MHVFLTAGVFIELGLLSAQSLPELLSHGLSRLVSPLIKEVGVCVEGHGDRGVTELFLHFLGRSAGSVHQACAGMTEVLDGRDSIDPRLV